MTRYEEAIREIGDSTPMNTDCGRICGKACCSADGDGQGGVFLMPFESYDAMRSWAAAEVTEAGTLLKCTGGCERASRPFMCRVFPLSAYRRGNGEWDVRMDARAAAVCPLAARGVRSLRPDFVSRVRRAVRIVAEDAAGEEFLRRREEEENSFRRERKLLKEMLGKGK